MTCPKYTIALFLVMVVTLPLTAEDPVEIDVMVLYTPAARDHAGDNEAIQADVLAAVAGANEVFEQSGIHIELNLVHQAEVDYLESDSIVTDLDRLAASDDSFMEEVHQLRDDWGADLVSLFRRGGAGGIAGYAKLLEDESGRPDLAFSVVSDESALVDHVFVHEIGHNLGAAHAHEDDDQDGLFPYSHGHRFTGDDDTHYRTVMASPTSDPPRTRAPRFSSPQVEFAGVPTGIPDGEPGAADNVRTLNFAAESVAGYQVHQPELPAFIRTSPTALGVVNGGGVSLSVEAAGVPPLALQWYEGEPGDTSQPVVGATAHVFETPALTDETVYWVRAENKNGFTDSVAFLVSVHSPPEGITVDQEQSEASSYRRLVDFDILWQEFVPEFDYLESVAVRVTREGDPGDLVLAITDASGMFLAERRLDAASVSDGFDWVEIPVGIILPPQKTYRIVLRTVGPEDSENSYGWLGGDDNPYPGGASSVDEHWPGFDFIFRTRGADIGTDTPPAYSSIFDDSEYTQDLGEGWKWNALGHLYDAFFPHVYSFGVGDWLFIIGESEEAYYFWALTHGYWAYTGAELYPYYLILTGEDSGTWIEVTTD